MLTSLRRRLRLLLACGRSGSRCCCRRDGRRRRRRRRGRRRQRRGRFSERGRRVRDGGRRLGHWKGIISDEEVWDAEIWMDSSLLRLAFQNL